MLTRRMSRFTIAAALSLCAAFIFAPTGRTDVQLPGDRTLKTVDFERHIMGLFGRQGCNAGSCHGSFQGKGGFRLSLFAYDPRIDYENIKDLSARRLNNSDVDKSLLLMKATGQLPHGGAVRFAPDSWQYQLLKTWIAQGARWTPGSGDIDTVTITPSEHAFAKPGQNVRLKVVARFKDGTEEDVTAFSDYRTTDDTVAEVSKQGEIYAAGPGTTAVIVTYRSQVLPVRVLVPTELPQGTTYPKVPSVNFVDDLVFARLQKLNMIPANLSTDNQFLRRVYIDTIGRLPTTAEVKSFLADNAPDKRATLIDKLLDDPMHAALWATKLCDITGNDTLALEVPQNLKAKRSQMWHEWFKKRVHENMPYDQIVKGILTATSREGKQPEDWARDEAAILDEAAKGFDFTAYANRPTLDLFWRKQQKVTNEQWGEKVAAAFLGVRLECAQCHKHPFDRWSQDEYRSFANIFGQVYFGASAEAKQVIADYNKKLVPDPKKANQVGVLKEVFLGKPAGLLPNLETGKPLPPKALGGPLLEAPPGQDLRVKLFEWMDQPDNAYFAPSFVNRVWGHYFGVGIVNPLDDFSLANPPTNDKLLAALAKEFVTHKYDIRHMERLILNSRTYQLSFQSNATNKFDKNCFSHAYIRPMMAEVVLDVIDSALDGTENWGKDIKPGLRAIELGPSFVQSPAGQALKLWGRPARTSACDCERSMEPGLINKLYLMTDPGILNKIKVHAAKLTKNHASNEEILQEAVLAMLTRPPNEKERQAFLAIVQKEGNRQAAVESLLASLVNCNEFIFNH